MTKPKYTQQELEQLYAIALRDGWDQLEQSERLAVGRYCRKQGLQRPGVTPSVAAQPVQAETGDRKPAEPEPLASPLPDPTETKPVESEARTVEKDEDLALLRSVRFIADGPADIHVKPARPESKWSKPAKALRRFEGRIAVIGENMERRAALNLKQRILHGGIKAFTPKGAYRVEVAPDHRHDGVSFERCRLDVYVQYPPNGRARADPSNADNVGKPIIDGFTKAGLWPDDNWRHVEGPFYRMSPTIAPKGLHRLEFHITETTKGDDQQ